MEAALFSDFFQIKKIKIYTDAITPATLVTLQQAPVIIYGMHSLLAKKVVVQGAQRT
jgi:hypothetical protein